MPRCPDRDAERPPPPRTAGGSAAACGETRSHRNSGAGSTIPHAAIIAQSSISEKAWGDGPAAGGIPRGRSFPWSGRERGSRTARGGRRTAGGEVRAEGFGISRPPRRPAPFGFGPARRHNGENFPRFPPRNCRTGPGALSTALFRENRQNKNGGFVDLYKN